MAEELEAEDPGPTEGTFTPTDPDLEARVLRATRLDGLSREALRRYAKAVGINPGGTKGDLLDRLAEAGTTVTDVNAHAHGLTHA